MTSTANLMDHLQEQGYDPDTHSTHSWLTAELVVSGIGTVRVIINDGSVEIFVFDSFMACEWDATLSNAPDAAIIAVIETAERQLADKRDGPVTPAQVEARS